MTLADGSEIPTRTVIIASGACYERLAVEGLEQFEGAGVYYAATDLEARTCSRLPVIVVGGNSAGQAAIYLAEQGCQVSIVIRSKDLEHSMSHYLIERVDAEERIELFTNTEIRGDSQVPTTSSRSLWSTRRRGTLHRPRVFGSLLLHRRDTRYCVVGECPGTGRKGLHSHPSLSAGIDRSGVTVPQLVAPYPLRPRCPASLRWVTSGAVH